MVTKFPLNRRNASGVFLVASALGATILTKSAHADPNRFAILEAAFIAVFLVLYHPLEEFRRQINTAPFVFALLALWLCGSLASFVFSPFDLTLISSAPERLLQVPLHLLFGWAVYSRQKIEAKRSGTDRWPFRALLAIASGGVLLVLVYILTWTVLEPETHNDWRHWMYAPPLASNVRYNGYLLTAAIGATAPLALRYRAGRRALAACVLALLTACVIWLGGRGAILSSFGATILCVYWLRPQTRSAIAALGCAWLVGAVVGQSLAVFPFHGLLRGVNRTAFDSALSGSSGAASTIESLSPGRLMLWKDTAGLIAERPLLGYGARSCEYLVDDGYMQPHNVVLQFLLEWGLLGGLPLLVLLAFLLIGLLRAPSPQASLGVTMGSSISVALFAHSLVDGTLFHPQPTFFFVLASAIALTQRANLASTVST